ncbi:hypothetical protein CNYM01_08922 [Colletotrichum nymphaeae SA-01]|uniref:Fungal N-terminal domain-containing protein n=1 Tax=Colletotrichum nymphaeae SA-01 TaxID=1460502 RepID=A0A135TQ76_9PEZI|nr:hypothetical protein CNYM01_08922 [Colletotrichum nymphaeae SA-01]
MATESVSLAASVAGLLSLGLQITGGIVKYMDAFEGRDEELRNVKKQNANLGSTLHAIKTVLAGLQGQSPAVAAAVDQNIRSCEEDLRAVEALCIELSDRAGSSWTNRLENKKRKATFAFHRPKLRDLELQLQKAHGSLQLIQGSLGLETSNRNTALLAAIQSSSRDQASEMLLVRSEVAAFATPVAGIHDKLPGLQSSVDQTRQLIVAHSGAIEVEVHESSQRVRHDLQQSHNSITEHLKTIDHKLQLLGEENSSLLALALRAASKPAALKKTIRFITFEALDLFHSCCNTHSLVEQGTAWIEQDDTEIFEDQGFLLELHEKLVAEFTHEAGTYMEDETYNGRMFPQFWTSYWAHRMTQELEVLHGEELTELEKRDAEEIGVVWHELNESDEREDRNPYHREDLEHYFFELDLICPEYNEPWPEGLRRIH